MRGVLLLFLLLSLTCTVICQEVSWEKNPSILKGNMFISTTFSLDHRESDNESTLIRNVDDSYRLNWDITLRSGYFIKDNFALGGFFKYSDKLNQQSYIGDNGDVKDETVERSYSLAPFMRNYLPLGNGQFCLFNETNLVFSYGSSVRQIEDQSDVSRIVGDTYELKLGIQPGIAAFINKLVSVEVGTSVLGLSSKYTKSTVDGDKDNPSTVYTNDVSFRIDILSLFLGLTFYFPVK